MSASKTTRTILLALAVVFVSAGIAQASTTISTNISTGGTLDVTGKTTLGNATSTMFSAYSAYFGGSATSSFSSAGALTLITPLTIANGGTGTTTSFYGGILFSDASVYRQASTTALLQWDPTAQVFTTTNASTTQVTVSGRLWVNGNATTTSTGNISTQGTLNVIGATTLASTTATTMKVGQVGTGMTRIVSGYCVTGSITIPATNASSTQTYADCTPSVSTSVISSGDRVFVQATSSLPYYVVIQSASSTPGGLITVGLTNFSTTTSPAAGIYAFNFWAFQ